jgi:hypothetical protein
MVYINRGVFGISKIQIQKQITTGTESIKVVKHVFFIVIDSHLRLSASQDEGRRLLAATLLKHKKHTAHDYWYLR